MAVTVGGAEGAVSVLRVQLFLISVVVFVVALLLMLPIHTRIPGDHETMSCGNALALDLGPARDYGDEYSAWEAAHRSCTSDRIDRVALAVGVVSITLPIVAFMTRRRSTGEDCACSSPEGLSR